MMKLKTIPETQYRRSGNAYLLPGAAEPLKAGDAVCITESGVFRAVPGRHDVMGLLLVDAAKGEPCFILARAGFGNDLVFVVEDEAGR